MNKLFSTLLLSLFYLISYAQNPLTTGNTKPKTSNKGFIQKDTLQWAVNLQQFRTALYTRNKPIAKQFFDFPVFCPNNEIWHAISVEINEKNEEIIPFTEKDFDKHFDRLFPSAFLKCFLKVKLDDAYQKGKSESPEVKLGKTTYKLYVTYDEDLRTLELNLATRTPHKISESEYEPGETNYIYRFWIHKNGHVKFKELLMAG